MIGDWNARLLYPTTQIEEELIGKHTMHNNVNISDFFTERVI